MAKANKETTRELHPQEENKLSKQENTDERTTAVRTFIPATDIVENKDSLVVTMDMPGVKKDNINISLDKNELEVEGVIDFEPYKNLKPAYTEYQVGNYARRFTVSSVIDTDKIMAALENGVLTLTLPKVPEAQPRKIEIT